MKIFILSNKNDAQMLKVTDEHIRQIKDVKRDLKVVLRTSPLDLLMKKELRDTDILLTTAGIPQIELLTNIKWIHVSSAGVDRLAQELKNSSIIITNSSGVHPIPISEHVLGFMLMFARQLNKSYKAQILDKKWSREIKGIFELYRKTAGIIGMGRVGSQITRLTKALGMRVLAVTRQKHEKQEFVDKLFTYKDLDIVLKEADFVINSLPATSETFHLFNADKFSKMKRSAYFINIGRGKTVKEDDLIDVLTKRKIAGAGLDVFETEPLSPKNRLWKLDNVIITPHISGWTPFYMDRVINIFCANLKAFLANKPLPNEIDKQKGY